MTDTTFTLTVHWPLRWWGFRKNEFAHTDNGWLKSSGFYCGFIAVTRTDWFVSSSVLGDLPSEDGV